MVLLAGDLTTHGEPEQAAGARRGLPRDGDARGRRARQPRPAREPGGRVGGGAERRGHRSARRARTPVLGRAVPGRRGRHEGLRRRLPRASGCRTSASHRCARSTRRRRTRCDALSDGPARDRPLPVPDRAAALRARSPTRLTASRPRSGPSWAATAWPPRSCEHRPDLVLHGHAHARAPRRPTSTASPVYNVSVPVMGQDFWIFELSGAAQAATAIH